MLVTIAGASKAVTAGAQGQTLAGLAASSVPGIAGAERPSVDWLQKPVRVIRRGRSNTAEQCTGAGLSERVVVPRDAG